ncbi:MAG: sulfurtransferase [Acidobacteriaceae bacterium]
MKWIVFLLVSACALAQVPHRDMIVSSEWLAAHLKDANLVLICVQESPGFCANHIPNSRTLSLGEMVTTREGIPNELPSLNSLARTFGAMGVTGDSHIVLYGERLGVLAARAYWTLDYLGLAQHASLLDGGMEHWLQEHRPLTNSALSLPKAGSLAFSLNPRTLTTTDELSARADAARIDARPEPEFLGERKSLNVAEAGHIPNATSLYWQRLLVSTNDPVFRSDEELRAMFATAARGRHEVITYCRTGMQSALDYFIAKYLGYDASMYDGSFFEWSRLGLPAEK